MVDSHVHSNYSPDSKICINEGCETAIQKNLDGLIFTDHFELDLVNAEHDFNFDIAKRSKDLDLAREKFGKK
ncbi:PHP domain-containing protein [Candidatus Dependentiae bacterium]|nr:PHP domain-containing protein [Candidatus Dependentiae bacterium]